jgi:OmpA-OmpF porin, OOP family
MDEPNTRDAPSGVPQVSVIELPKPVVFRSCGSIILGDTGSLRFVADQAEFLDKGAAMSALKELAERIIRDEREVRLIGTTSSGIDSATQVALSLARAEAVAEVLVGLGVPSKSVTTTGMGKDFVGYVPDVGVNGAPLPGSAAQNRSVIVELTACA